MMIDDSDDPDPSTGIPLQQVSDKNIQERKLKDSAKFSNGNGSSSSSSQDGVSPGFFNKIKEFVLGKQDQSFREAIEDYIGSSEIEESDHHSLQEKMLLLNILHLRDIKVMDVMVPRADIVAVQENISQSELLTLLSQKQYSRIPVYRENLDDVLGTIHIKDILAVLAQDKKISIAELVSDVPIISPSMPVLDLILVMRHQRRHMAFVVDEYGGIDGLVTIGDIIEAIVGDIEDEHETSEEPKLKENKDGSVMVDARYDIEEFENRYGDIFTTEDREESDTLGGLVCAVAGRVPARGELVNHESGLVFEILEADPRRVGTLRIRNIEEAASIYNDDE